MDPANAGAPVPRSRRVLVRRCCRVRAHLDVRIELSNGRRVDGVTADISVGGMFVVCREPADVGTKVRIVCCLPDERRSLEVVGTVRWTKASGFGVQFGLLGARETHAIVQIVVASSRRHAG